MDDTVHCMYVLMYSILSLGVSLRPMCICLELAPMGSLFGILDKRLEAIKQAQADLPSAIIRMPGGVLGHEISARIALQVSNSCRCTSEYKIIRVLFYIIHLL